MALDDLVKKKACNQRHSLLMLTIKRLERNTIVSGGQVWIFGGISVLRTRLDFCFGIGAGKKTRQCDDLISENSGTCRLCFLSHKSDVKSLWLLLEGTRR